jgi:hypothetical protein
VCMLFMTEKVGSVFIRIIISAKHIYSQSAMFFSRP